MPRGGARPGAGRPRKPLNSRISEGVDAVSHRKPKVIEFPDEIQTANSKEKSKPNSKTVELPTFLEMASKEGGDVLPTAAQIYMQTLDWVISTGCEKFVPKQLIEDFAFVRRGYLETEYMNRRLGRVVAGGKQSPYVKTVMEYLKAMTSLYREIWAIVAQNSTTDFAGSGSNAFLDLLRNRGF